MSRLAAGLAGFFRAPYGSPGNNLLAQTFIAAARSLRRAAPAHLPLYVSVIVFFAASLGLLSWYGRAMPLSSGLFFLRLVSECLLLWAMTLAAWDIVQLWRDGAPSGLARLLLERMSARLLKGERPGNSFHALATLIPMMIAFSIVKENIAAISPFAWDKTFAQWDLVLGFGRMPWEILQPAFNYPAVTIGLNFAYHLWFFLMFGVLIWQGFSARASVLRMQFLLAFCFVWFFGGSVLAIVFSSAGPCFYGDLFAGPSPFAAQAAYLQTIGPEWIWSLTVQHDLWQSYKTGSGAISGISAMPSMHVTIAVLNALLCWRVNRRLGIAFSVFAGIIFIGSIVLLWHYAVDGIAAAAIAYLCWTAAGFVARRWHDTGERLDVTDWKTAQADSPA